MRKDDDIEPRFPAGKLNATQVEPSALVVSPRKVVVKSTRVTIRPNLDKLFDDLFSVVEAELEDLRRKRMDGALSIEDHKRLSFLTKNLVDASKEERQRSAERDKSMAEMSEEDLKNALKDVWDNE